MTLYDPVTDLPNRSNFLERLAFYIWRARATRRLVVVGFIDLTGSSS